MPFCCPRRHTQHLTIPPSGLQRDAVRLYALNTLGGVIGLGVVTGFGIRYLGIPTSMLVLVGVNLVVAVQCYQRSLREPAKQVAVQPTAVEPEKTGAEGFRQPAMYFPNGGSTLRGVSRPGEIVWSRIYVEDNALAMDIGRGAAIALPRDETERRWNATTPQWPIMHAVLYGVSRDQMMAQHKSNHVQVVYADDAVAADRTLEVKAAMARALGLRVNICGTQQNT